MYSKPLIHSFNSLLMRSTDGPTLRPTLFVQFTIPHTNADRPTTDRRATDDDDDDDDRRRLTTDDRPTTTTTTTERSGATTDRPERSDRTESERTNRTIRAMCMETGNERPNM